MSDHPKARELDYGDVQRYLKMLRKYTRGRLRFFASGEYGERKGRAHWHTIVFCETEPPPNVLLEKRYMHKSGNGRLLWPHGFSWWRRATPEAMRYAVKYILPSEHRKHRPIYRFSTVPLLGLGFFRLLASRYVHEQLPPHVDYRFPEDYRWQMRDGQRRQVPCEYRLSRSALYHFLGEYERQWMATYGNDRWPGSELMDAYIDEKCRRSEGESFELAGRRMVLRAGQEKGAWVRGIGTGDPVGLCVRLYPPQLGPNAYAVASRAA